MSFGGGVQSTWGQPQQNQQQQTNAFGQPANTGAFGSTGFGSTGAFGQPAQQQPQANPMFGSTANTGTTGAFGGGGGFGGAATTSAFGAPKPAGFGAFGGGAAAAPATGAFGGGGGAFGATNTGTSAFGSTPTSTFGSTGAFGQAKPATSVFGSTNATNSTDPVAPVNTGSSNPPYSSFSEKDSSAPNTTLQYQSISCMPAYRGTSFEELRAQDYAQGRKTASASAGAFGASAFGTQQPAATGAFGQPTTGAFGATNTGNAFGGGGAFGANTTPAPAGNSVFGGGNTTTGAFGQPAQPAATSAFGQPQQNTGSIFGGGTTGAFGAKPAGGAFGTGGAFGSGGAFGGGTATAAPSAFGAQPAAGTSAFGTFGTNTANNAPKPGVFGSTAPATGAFGGGAFGQNTQQQQPAPQTSLFGGGTTGGNLFGNNANQPAQPAAPGNSLFGAQPQAPSTGLFGNTNPGGSIFGNNNNTQPNQNASTSLFGAKPNPTPAPTTGLFGQQPANPQQPGTGLFGNAGQNNNGGSSIFGGGGNSLFGAKPAGPAPNQGMGTSTFGNSMFGGGAGGGASTFGASNTTAQPQQQPSLTASLAQPINTSAPIFSNLPSGPRAVDFDQSTKKKAGFFVDVPTRAPIPRVQLGYQPGNSRLRGFGSTNLASSTSFNMSSSMLGSSRNNLNASSFLGSNRSSTASPALGSGNRKSVKKLIMDKKVEPNTLFVKSGSMSPSKGGRITFSPALSVAARESEVSQIRLSTPPPPRNQRTPTKFTASQVIDAPDEGPSLGLKEGDYWVKPDLEELKKMSHDQLRSFENLVVGRVEYGEIHFLERVDLTGLPRLSELLGEVVRFDDKECSVYPDSDDVDKPPKGQGLNVKARISLRRCWAVDKATREPIKDENHPAAIKHLKRLRNMGDTHFEGFDPLDGTWTFTVDHF